MIANENQTLPDLADEVGIRLDRLRKLVRRDAKLQALFAWVGGARVLRRGMLDALKARIGELEM